MSYNRVILTSDDGVMCSNILKLGNLLQDKGIEVKAALTSQKLNGLGGAHFQKKSYDWDIKVINGIETLVVDGYPVDAIEMARSIFFTPFDLCISGINPSFNLGGAIYSSGTVMAATRAFCNGTAKRAVAISTDISDNNKSVDEAFKILKLIDDSKLYECKVLNVNIPQKGSSEYKFTEVDHDLTKQFHYPLEIDRFEKTFSYPKVVSVLEYITGDTDLSAIQQGNISISKII